MLFKRTSQSYSRNGQPATLQHQSKRREPPPRAPPDPPVALQIAAETGPAAAQGKPQTAACFPILLDLEAPSQLRGHFTGVLTVYLKSRQCGTKAGSGGGC